MARICVFGGTGSFGTAFVKRYHTEHEITVVSRDELKQHDLRNQFPDVWYVLGDIRDRQRVSEILAEGFDYIFQAAALKQVPSCEFSPMEAVKTNILGTSHVLDAANGAKVVFLSTDKAVYPINAMGISKAMAEKVATVQGAVITRYGNVMGSRGSVIPLWRKAVAEGKPVTITNPKMTRFLLSLDDSIDLVMYAMEHGEKGEIFVKKAPACTMDTLANAIGGTKQLIGIRHGEKMHESLISQEEMHRTEDLGSYFRIKPDNRDLNYDKFFVDGQEDKTAIAYSSDVTEQLNVEQVKELLRGVN